MRRYNGFWCLREPSTVQDRLAKGLNANRVPAEAIHGNKSQNQRQRALDGFKRGHQRVLVATDIAARGLDIEMVTHVINYELPNIPESYVHRIGRTARAGESGVAISFCDQEEREFLRDIERVIGAKVPVEGVPSGMEVIPQRREGGSQPVERRGPSGGGRSSGHVRPASSGGHDRRQPSGNRAPARPQASNPPRQQAHPGQARPAENAPRPPLGRGLPHRFGGKPNANAPRPEGGGPRFGSARPSGNANSGGPGRSGGDSGGSSGVRGPGSSGNRGGSSGAPGGFQRPGGTGGRGQTGFRRPFSR